MVAHAFNPSTLMVDITDLVQNQRLRLGMVALSFSPSTWEVEEFEASQGYIVRSCLKVPSPSHSLIHSHTHSLSLSAHWAGGEMTSFKNCCFYICLFLQTGFPYVIVLAILELAL